MVVILFVEGGCCLIFYRIRFWGVVFFVGGWFFFVVFCNILYYVGQILFFLGESQGGVGIYGYLEQRLENFIMIVFFYFNMVLNYKVSVVEMCILEE